MNRETYATLCCCCCCGGLPIVALVKAAFGIPISLVIMTGGCTLGAVLMLPHDVFFIYRAVVSTGLIGVKLKALTMLVLPIALVLWPCVVAVISAIAAIGWPMVIAQKATFSSRQNICFGGCLFDGYTWFPVVRNAINATRDYWHFNYHSMFDYLVEVRDAQSETPFDIGLCTLFMVTVQAPLCSTWLMVLSSVLCGIKGLPIILAAYYNLLRQTKRKLIKNGYGLSLQKFFVVWGFGFVGFILMLIFIPVLFVLFYTALIFASGYFGICCAVKAYQYHLCAGFKAASNYSRTLDQCTTWTILFSIKTSDGKSYDELCSCFPKFDLDAEYASVTSPFTVESVAIGEGSTGQLPGNILTTTIGIVSMQTIWDNFFTQCEETMRLGLKRGVLKLEELDRLDRFIFLGVPAAVVVRFAYNSNDLDCTSDVLKFSDMTLLTARNRPHNFLADKLYTPMVQLKHALKRANFSKEQSDDLWNAVLRQDTDLVAGIDSRPKATELFSQATEIGVLVSRLPQFRRRFHNAIAKSKQKKVSGIP